MRKSLFLPFLFALSFTGCGGGASVWDSEESWYDCGREVRGDFADVFYLVSTNVLSSYNLDGNEEFRVALVPEEKAAMDGEFKYARDMFGDSLNFYAPYYHQFTMNAIRLDSMAFNAVYGDVREEVLGAFRHYMEKMNGGRHFILAGFSQGAMLVLDLLKNMEEEWYGRMDAAYMIGYRLSGEDLAYPYVRAAHDEMERGVTISYNSVSSTDCMWPFVSGGAAACINPVNWCTDATPAGLLFDGDEFSVSVDTLSKVLVVSGLDSGRYVFPALEDFCPEGNLHHWDILFYRNSIHGNALKRAYGR